ncbi:ABC-2 type transport system ATP-binding protein [Zymomonas mobilis]|uniref:ABC-2 type transport system ATP-binding protein n=1 Tax=Zymomonas mobilis TaxID=542 RepID=A0A542W1I4_ZYMMB|nr:ABC transporter ATP-binding protein [Zymomonas mobilis]TQL17427.1 ABC-2 type transport system ATP-binding protein [Zymomonas mobilis]
MPAAIQLTRVSKNFGTRPVLKNIDLTVPKGSLFAFLGNNGQGKSTTIRIITGLYRITSGKVIVLGQDMQSQPIPALERMGCLVDSPSLYNHMTAREFLKIGCVIKNIPYQEIDRVLEIVNLHTEPRLKIALYSLGMRQRLALAHALLGNPELLILDEPTNGLDPEGIKEIRELLISLPEKTGCTIFFSSHQLEEVEKTASHLALLDQGKILFQGQLEEIRAAGRSALLLDVLDVEKAFNFLLEAKYEVSRYGEHQLLVEKITRKEASALYRQLMAADIEFYQAVLEKPSLEQWFSQQMAISRNKA